MLLSLLYLPAGLPVAAGIKAGTHLAGRARVSRLFPALQDGKMTGFLGECFHVFNKHASAAEVKPYFQTEEVGTRR